MSKIKLKRLRLPVIEGRRYTCYRRDAGQRALAAAAMARLPDRAPA